MCAASRASARARSCLRVAQAGDLDVLRAVGIESEADLAFAGCRPAPARLDLLDDPQRPA